MEGAGGIRPLAIIEGPSRNSIIRIRQKSQRQGRAFALGALFQTIAGALAFNDNLQRHHRNDATASQSPRPELFTAAGQALTGTWEPCVKGTVQSALRSRHACFNTLKRIAQSALLEGTLSLWA